MSSKIRKAIVGFALINDLFNMNIRHELLDLYANPVVEDIVTLYEKLIKSDNHIDRDAAFWLELALENRKELHMRINLRDIVIELKEMEVLMYDLLWRVDANTQRDLNDWLNYMINSYISIQEGYWIDSKSFMSKAVESAQRESIEEMKKMMEYGKKVELLQTELMRCFEQIKKLPTKLSISRDMLDPIIEVQQIMLKLMKRKTINDEKIEIKHSISRSIRSLNAALKSLMRSNPEEAIKDIEMSLYHLKEIIANSKKLEVSNLSKMTLNRTEKLSTDLDAKKNTSGTR